MSHIAHVTLRNWMPYRGAHELALGSDVYAIVARYDANPDRSNYAGKSSLLGALRFGLFGERPEQCQYEDDWITRGEPDGSVEVRLSDGVSITRKRKRGQATQLCVQGLPGVAGAATGKHAVEVLERYLSMTARDFCAGAWLGQADIARMVLARPAERAQLVEGWLQLEPLRKAERAASEYVSTARAKCEQVQQRSAALQAALPQAPDDAAVRELASRAPKLVADLEQTEQLLDELRAERAELQAQAQAHERRARLQRTVDQLRDQGADQPWDEQAQREQLSQLEAARVEAAHAERTTRAEAERLRALVRGDGFDGRCPVMCDTCPVADEVQDRGRGMAVAARSATQAARSASEAMGVAASQAQDASAQLEARMRLYERYAHAARELAHEPVPDEDVAAGDVGERLAQTEQQRGALRTELQAVRDELTRIKYQRDQAARSVQELADLEQQAGECEAQARTYSAASAVLRGARREVAEGAVGEIEGAANQLLLEAGVDLTVVFRWERAGQGLATHCAKCGWGYPSSARVTRCEKCGAERGQKSIEALELLPSARSGAADALAGLAVQLAAAAWLRARRASPVGLVVVDEPFASLDRAHCAALGAHLHRALAGSLAFEQAFVVSHDQSVTEAMPRRIVVRSDGRYARLEIE